MNNVLVINLVLNSVLGILAVRFMLLPHIHAGSLQQVATPILLFHGMRHMGLMFLAPGVVSPDLSPLFAYPAAIGDAVSAALAMLALYLIRARSRFGVPAAWIFTVVGLLDFSMAIALSRYTQSFAALGAAYWIPAFFVPLLLAAHYALFEQLRAVSGSRLAKA
jgi:hypothetical protein